MNRRRAEVLLFLLACAGCGATPTPGSSGDSPRPSASAAASSDAAPTASASASASAVVEAPDPGAVTVTTVSVPSHLVLDGDPSDWGALTILPGASRTEKPQRPGPSHVAVAITSKSVYVVGAIAGGAKAGFQLALHFTPPGFPEVGVAQRGGGMMPLGDCAEEIPGLSLPVDDCKRVRANHEAFAAKETARYTRVFTIRDSGIGSDVEALKKVLAGATFKAKTSGDGFTFEAELPIAALPRATEAPISSIGLAASTTTLALTDEATFSTGGLSPSVELEPNAAARAAAFFFTQLPSYSRRPQVTYQPGDANKIEVLDYAGGDMLSLETVEHVLFTKLGGEGDMEFGIVDVHAPVLLASRGGKMTGFHPYHSTPKSIAPKKLAGVDGWVLAAPWVYDTDEISSLGQVKRGAFDAAFVDKAGNVTEVFPSGSDPYAWKTVTPTIAPNLDTLTLTGQAYDLADLGARPTSKQHVWRWDAKLGGYADNP